MHRIRLARLEDLQGILSILNETTLDLKQKGIDQWSYPWDEIEIANQVINNNSYVLCVDNEVIGTFFIHDIESINELWVESGNKYLSKIAISQSTKVGNWVVK
ncbi:hypothetical protein ACOI1C_12750 [Bacillus sp. DJP31]|uniref:hypothetical protein n=1 Tax=Bacillus sp. DJP31 TaxID=3409789 RepID=UPI003BB5E655